MTLTARNHFIRDNWIYRTADAIRLGYLAIRRLDQQAKQEARARQLETAMRSSLAMGSR